MSYEFARDTPEKASFDSPGGSGQLTVATSRDDCPWRTKTDSDWIHLFSPNGKGPGNVAYKVDPNDYPLARSGTITLADRVIYLEQAPGAKPSTETKTGRDYSN